MVKKNITITDVALASGVSKTTISRYLNGRTDLMSDKTRARIEKVIALLDYHPSELARSLKSKKTHTIGVIVSEIRAPFFTSVISGIEETLIKQGYSAIFMDCENKKENEEQYIKEVLSKNVEGLIINTTSVENDNVISLDVQKLPIVLCDRNIKNHKLDIVSIDNKQMMHDLFDHLQQQGYNRFALFTEPWKDVSTRYDRRKYFLKEIKDRFGYDAERDVYSIGDKIASFEEAVDKFAKTFGSNDIPVIVGVNTVSTFSTYKALMDKGFKVPQEVAICGPDDWSWGNFISWPDITGVPITTMEFDSKYVGRRTAQMLLERINNPDKEIESILVESKLVIRKSTLRKEG